MEAHSDHQCFLSFQQYFFLYIYPITLLVDIAPATNFDQMTNPIPNSKLSSLVLDNHEFQHTMIFLLPTSNFKISISDV